MRAHALAVTMLILLTTSAAQHSKPVASNEQLPSSKFTERKPHSPDDIIFGSDGSGVTPGNSQCPIDVELIWSTQLDSGVYATPLIRQLLSDGTKQIVVPGFTRDLTVLDATGNPLPGWPVAVSNDAQFHASPVLLDYNRDGIADYVWTSVNAEIFIIDGDPSRGPTLLRPPIHIPKLRVRKNWYTGLDESQPQRPDPNAHAHNEPAGSQQQDRTRSPSYRRRNYVPLHMRKQQQQEAGKQRTQEQQQQQQQQPQQQQQEKLSEPTTSTFEQQRQRLRQRLQRLQQQQQQGSAATYAPGRAGAAAAAGGEAQMQPPGARRLMSVAEDNFSQIGDGLTEEGRESLTLFLADAGETLLTAADVNKPPQYPREKTHVWVDAHVLATPSVIDVNGDGREELVFSVSYFFDEDEYRTRPELFLNLDVDVDIKKYVAGGVVVIDPWSGEVVWSEHLDLSTDETALKAYIYSPPTVIDLDGDGDLEVIVGTSLGLIYALRAATGSLLPGFPLTMSEIQAQVAVEDVNQDGQLELIAVDKLGNVLCFNKRGEEVWETRIAGFAAQAPSFGDINGDGIIDVVVGTVEGHVWALRGDNGQVLPNFPIRTEGRIIAPITLVNLYSGSGLLGVQTVLNPFALTGLHLVFPSFDGHVYIVEGTTGCINKIDIGEHAYGMVLVDDVLGTGKLDLLVTTMSGSILLFGTNAPYWPTKTWSSQTQGLNGFTARDRYQGVFVSGSSRRIREVVGSEFEIELTIIDSRAQRNIGDSSKRRYDVTVSYGRHQLLLSRTYHAPGTYREVLPALDEPVYAVLTVEMMNEHRQLFTDSFVLGFNVHFYRPLKFLLVVPFMLVAGFLLLLPPAGVAKGKQPKLQD